MQANTITLAVDIANNGTTVDLPLSRHEEALNRSTYVSDENTPDSRDTLQLYRTAHKRNGEFRGASKTSAKFTTDISVANASGSGNITVPLIGEVSFSVPVGATSAQTMELRQRIIALLDDDTIAGGLVDLLSI